MKNSILATVLFGAILTASSTMAQVPPAPGAMPCPNPTTQTISLTTPVVVNAEFSAAALAAPRAGINDPISNKVFLHTFRWDPPACCQITSATLTVVLRANQQGVSPPTSPDAGNDTIGVSSGGVGLPGMGGRIYTSPVTTNQQVTKTFVMDATGLAAMNANNRLSFSLQDDTRVVSATLRIERCCVRR